VDTLPWLVLAPASGGTPWDFKCGFLITFVLFGFGDGVGFATIIMEG